MEILISGIFLGFSDLCLALSENLRWKIENARYKFRDERNRITWVYDRLFGLYP